MGAAFAARRGGGMMHVVSLAQVAVQPWKNGGGSTRELWCWPAAPAAWQLRVSVAEVARSGPFSAYPGVARWFCVLQGAGVKLHFADRNLALTPDSAALHFDGALAPDCTLLDGPTLDLNLMLRPAAAALDAADSHAHPHSHPHSHRHATASANPHAHAGGAAEMTRAVPGQPWATGAPLRAVFSLHASTLHRAGHAPVALPAASLACDTAPGGEAWHLEGQALHAWWLACTPCAT